MDQGPINKLWLFSRRTNRPSDFDDILESLESLESGGRRIIANLPGLGKLGPGVFALAGLLLWLASGSYQVDQASQAIVRIFGIPQAPVGAGLHWRLPAPIGEVDVVKIREVKNLELGFRTTEAGAQTQTQPVPVEALMITGDTNIVDVEMIVQYRIKDILTYLFNVADPGVRARPAADRPDGRTLTDATEAALRQVVGSRTLNDILTVERAAIEGATLELLQQLLDAYGTGLHIERVQLQIVKPPREVEAAFLDVVSAREEKERMINQARAYEADIIPKAQGEAQQMLSEAQGFRRARVSQAEGDSARFLSVLKEYQQAKGVTRTRLHLEAMEAVLPNIQKYIVAATGGGSLVQVLPLQATQVDLAPPAPQPARPAPPVAVVPPPPQPPRPAATPPATAR
ncbi:MAG: FtsH protease activity modulator HflK [Dehalococcoidia bacterium]|nr:FtsH protease activity modulator HflK [Dehalococcoidia bacterium]